MSNTLQTYEMVDHHVPSDSLTQEEIIFLSLHDHSDIDKLAEAHHLLQLTSYTTDTLGLANLALILSELSADQDSAARAALIGDFIIGKDETIVDTTTMSAQLQLASTLVAQVTGSHPVIADTKLAIELYIDYSSDVSPTRNDSIALEQIAQQCIQQYGYAVSLARATLSQYGARVWSDADDCEVAQGYSRPDALASASGFCPSPTTDIVQYSDESITEVVVYDMLGDIVKIDRSPNYSIDMSDMINGTYIVLGKDQAGDEVLHDIIIKIQ